MKHDFNLEQARLLTEKLLKAGYEVYTTGIEMFTYLIAAPKGYVNHMDEILSFQISRETSRILRKEYNL